MLWVSRLTPDSLWGVWLLQFLFIFFTLFFIYKLLDQEFGIYAALAGTIVLTSGLLTILEKGNVTEEYALVFQALCFWLFVRAWKKDFPIRTSFWIGLLGGLAFNFKQTTIGIWITYALFLLADSNLPKKVSFQGSSLPAGRMAGSIRSIDPLFGESERVQRISGNRRSSIILYTSANMKASGG